MPIIAPSNNTEVRLISNVPLSNKYDHQLKFGSATEQASYFSGKASHTFSDFTYVREEQAIKVPADYDSLYNCNYVMYKNTTFGSKWFYAFITRREYINPNTTKIYVELDVYQTWQFDITFKPSFVEREHRDRWNADGTPVINTIDEGLAYGTDYDTVSIENFVPYKDNYFLVIACKWRMDTNDTTKAVASNVNGLPQPLSYYVHPFKLNGASPNTVWSGSPYTALSTIQEVLDALYKIEGAQNNIVSLFITEHVGEDISYDEGTDTLTMPTTVFEPVSIQGSTSISTYRAKENKIYGKTFKSLGNKYDGYASVSESKLLMHPYTVLIMDDFKGGRIEYKNEYIDSNNLILTVKGSMGTSNKVTYTLEQYNSPSLSGTDLERLSQEHALINSTPNDVPIITDLLAAYLQGNRNTLANQENSLLYGSVANTIGSAMAGIGSAVARNPVGAVGAVGGIVNSGAQGYFGIQGMIAKKQDIDNTPPQISKMGSNSAFDYGNGYTGVYLIKKQVKAEYRKKLEDYFKMYGYKINEVKVPNMATRQHFNFVKTVGANITGNVPHDDLASLKNMFDNGITLWHSTDVGNYALANAEV